MIYLLESLSDKQLKQFLKGKYQKIKWTAIIKILFLALIILLSIFFMAYYYKEYATNYVSALLICFVVIPISLLELLYHGNSIKAADALMLIEDSSRYLSTYANKRISYEHLKNPVSIEKKNGKFEWEKNEL